MRHNILKLLDEILKKVVVLLKRKVRHCMEMSYTDMLSYILKFF